jgi:hypothetical protein
VDHLAADVRLRAARSVGPVVELVHLLPLPLQELLDLLLYIVVDTFLGEDLLKDRGPLLSVYVAVSQGVLARR